MYALKMRNVSEHRYIYPSVLHVAHGWSVTIEKRFQVIYTVFHKKTWQYICDHNSGNT